MGTGLLVVKRGFILFIKDDQFFTQKTRLREREKKFDIVEIKDKCNRL